PFGALDDELGDQPGIDEPVVGVDQDPREARLLAPTGDRGDSVAVLGGIDVLGLGRRPEQRDIGSIHLSISTSLGGKRRVRERLPGTQSIRALIRFPRNLGQRAEALLRARSGARSRSGGAPGRSRPRNLSLPRAEEEGIPFRFGRRERPPRGPLALPPWWHAPCQC